MTDGDREPLESRGDGSAADGPDGEAIDAAAVESDATDASGVESERSDSDSDVSDTADVSDATSDGLESDATDSESTTVDGVDFEAGPPADDLYFPPCPHCGQRMITITSRGPREHTAGPCGCRLTREEVRRL